MAVMHCEFFGHAIEKMSGCVVVVPEGQGRGPFPVLYLLHGLSDDHTAWSRRTSIERYVEGKPLIVVMPDGHRSFYINGAPPGGLAYEDHIVKDVVGFVDRTFHTRHARDGRALAGLSMGGYGSLMLALRHPDVFCCASSHSAALYFGHFSDAEQSPWALLLGPHTTGGPYDCFALAQQRAAQKTRPALRLDCGTEDHLISANRQFHEHLEQIHYPHEYREYPGAHTWAYWDAHVIESIDFAMEHVR